MKIFENLNYKEVENLIQLINTGHRVNMEIAFQIAKTLDIDLKKYQNKFNIDEIHPKPKTIEEFLSIEFLFENITEYKLEDYEKFMSYFQSKELPITWELTGITIWSSYLKYFNKFVVYETIFTNPSKRLIGVFYNKANQPVEAHYDDQFFYMLSSKVI